MRNDHVEEIDESNLDVQDKALASGAQGAIFTGYYQKFDVSRCDADRVVLAQYKRVPVVLKTHHMESSTEDTAHEIAVLKGLKHPNIIKLLGAVDFTFHCEEPQQLAMVLEYAPDGTLQTYLNKQPNLGTSLKYALNVAAALAYLHGIKDTVQLDLKPANVLLKGAKAKLCDFGLATTVGSQLDRPSGSFLFMDPTQLEFGFKEAMARKSKQELPVLTATPAFDVYSFAVLLCCCVKGTNKPYPHEVYQANEAMLIFNLCIQKRSIPKPDLTSVPASFAELISNCWSTCAEQRPTMKDVEQRLIELTDSQNKTLMLT